MPESESRTTPPPPTAVVIFGASGDLTHRKLVPALANLAQDQFLPENFIVIGAARTKQSDDEFRAGLKESVQEFSRRKLTDEEWSNFAKNIFYQPLDGTKLEDFAKLKERLKSIEKERSVEFNYLYYLSTAPTFFGTIAGNLKAAGLVEDPNASRKTAVVVEKPFGHDLESAKALNSELIQHLSENQIFRIDHYLGKETVQNILVFRFGNGIFEPLWNSKYIDNIQLSVCEDIGLGGRAEYFDKNGILRDIVQNHALQILSLLCIEPPISLSDPKSIRDEKVKVLRSMRRMTQADVLTRTVRGQYARGVIEGQKTQGYLEEKGVQDDSKTETYVAMQLEIDNWRWAGVPIFIRTGKRLPKRITEITVQFKRPPESLFKEQGITDLEPNALTIQVQPKEGISLWINSKPPGPRMRIRPVEMDFTYDSSFNEPSPEAYERLLLDAMKSNPTLFIRADEIEEAWDLLSPVLEAWSSSKPPPLYQYAGGSWGPEATDELLARSGRKWRTI